MSTVNLKFTRLTETAIAPVYATPGAACMDIAADEVCVVEPHKAYRVRTGLSFEYGAGYTLAVFSRSGHGAKRGIRLANGTGIIDPDYRGELEIALFNDSLVPFAVARGDRIAQAMLIQSPRIRLEEVSQLSLTERNAGGFGSSGK